MFALLNRKDPNHQRVKNTLLTYTPSYLIPTGVLAEIAYLLEQRLGFHALDAFLNDLQAGVLRLEHDPADLIRIPENSLRIFCPRGHRNKYGFRAARNLSARINEVIKRNPYETC